MNKAADLFEHDHDNPVGQDPSRGQIDNTLSFTQKEKSESRIPSSQSNTYTAADIEVLEGLEPVRKRPGMYIGGTDEKALHHLFAEVIDNAMDEAIAGHASWIEVNLHKDGSLTVTDNGRGIPVDPHPKFHNRSALEVIMTTLHAGGKFDSTVYETSGGLHGVGVSVVNALSDHLEVEVALNRQLYRQSFSRGHPITRLEHLGEVHNRRGTKITFHPDPKIFGSNICFRPALLFKMARAKAYLFGGVEIRWSFDADKLSNRDATPQKEIYHFPGGLKDYLNTQIKTELNVIKNIFSGQTGQRGSHGSVEWAINWFAGDGFISSYCNTIPTNDGGTHEAGLKVALVRGLKNYAELTGHKKASIITAEDVMTSAAVMLSVFIREPEFVGQTKDKLATLEANRIVETAIRDAFDHWLTASPNQANRLLDWIIDRAEERLRRRQEKEVNRKTATRKLRLPGKLADCTASAASGSELFIVEGDSAGGSAKQARNRSNQAVLPLRGKILNVANAGQDKMANNQQLSDLIQALGCSTGSQYSEKDLRYDKIIIMTDADVDGAHIASLLITFFYKQIPQLIDNGHLYLAVPPLYRISQSGRTLYARDDEHRDVLLKTEFKGYGKVDIGRFKGLGEMLPKQLKETTMDPTMRTLLKIEVESHEYDRTQNTVDELMGNKPEARFKFIQENAKFVSDIDI